jgi:5-histidylcysteine sulfoxide synthase
MSWDDMDAMQEDDFKWPDLSETIEFKQRCKAVVEKVIDELPDTLAKKPIRMDDMLWSLPMGFDHERIHLETSSVLMRQLPIDAVVHPDGWTYAKSNATKPEDAPKNKLISVPAGKAVLGKPRDFPSFGWDNEYGQREVDVPAFEASQFLVTNAEFLPFVLAGGYREKKWWLDHSGIGDDEGWRWATFRNATHPSFWVATKNMPEYFGGTPTYPYQKDDGNDRAGEGSQFMYRAIFDIIEMPWDWPAEVNYHEAKAFCKWKGAQDGKDYRVPTEAEWHNMRGVTDIKENEFARDPVMNPNPQANVNLKYGSPCPVNEFPPSSAGFYDTLGNVWEYVEDHFAPLPGYEIHDLYDDFSTPCYDGWHTMLVGGSFISTGDEASYFARFHFRRHFFQHLGFRYLVPSKVEEWPGEHTVANLWEGKLEVNNAVLNGFAQRPEILTLAPKVDIEDSMMYSSNVAKLCQSVLPSGAQTVLDIGCGVGATAFELSTVVQTIVGIDTSEGLIQQARLLQHHGEVRYERPDEGIIMSQMLAKVPAKVDRSRVSFLQVTEDEYINGTLDAGIAGHSQFDLVLVEDVLDKLNQPLNLARALAALVKPGGKLVVLSGNNWTKQRTPRVSWLGGFVLNGETMKTLDVLKFHFKKAFTFEKVEDLPKMTRNHDRHLEIHLLEASVWCKM